MKNPAFDMVDRPADPRDHPAIPANPALDLSFALSDPGPVPLAPPQPDLEALLEYLIERMILHAEEEEARARQLN